MFGCAWKINFPEIIFSWPCVLKALTRKWFEVKIFTSNHFRTHAQRERKSLRLRLCRSTNQSRLRLCQLRRSRLQLRRSSTQSLRPTDLWTHEPIFDPEPSTSPATQSLRATNPQNNLSLSLSLSLSLCDFDRPTNRSTFLCDFDFLLSLFDLWFFLLLLWWCGWWCFGGFPVVWWWVLCGWWWKIAFSECYQTHEIFFFLNFHNATKYLKIFSFPENSISRKYLFFGKYFTWTKHNLIEVFGWVSLCKENW